MLPEIKLTVLKEEDTPVLITGTQLERLLSASETVTVDESADVEMVDFGTLEIVNPDENDTYVVNNETYSGEQLLTAVSGMLTVVIRDWLTHLDGE